MKLFQFFSLFRSDFGNSSYVKPHRDNTTRLFFAVMAATGLFLVLYGVVIIFRDSDFLGLAYIAAPIAIFIIYRLLMRAYINRRNNQ